MKNALAKVTKCKSNYKKSTDQTVTMIGKFLPSVV